MQVPVVLSPRSLANRARQAKRHGMTLDQYLERLASEGWCNACKAWHPAASFGRDKNRHDGRARTCKAVMHARSRTWLNELKERAAAETDAELLDAVVAMLRLRTPHAQILAAIRESRAKARPHGGGRGPAREAHERPPGQGDFPARQRAPRGVA